MCSSDKSSGLGHPAPLPHSDCNVEPVADIERDEIQLKVTGARFLKDCMGILSKHVAHCQSEKNPALKVNDRVVHGKPSAPQTTVTQQQPGFTNYRYALLEGNIILRQGQGGAI